MTAIVMTRPSSSKDLSHHCAALQHVKPLYLSQVVLYMPWPLYIIVFAIYQLVPNSVGDYPGSQWASYSTVIVTIWWRRLSRSGLIFRIRGPRQGASKRVWAWLFHGPFQVFQRPFEHFGLKPCSNSPPKPHIPGPPAMSSRNLLRQSGASNLLD